MILIKNEKDYVVFVQYSCNSGWCTVESVEVVAKNNDTIDCEKIAKKQMDKYKKDIQNFYTDIDKYGDPIQKSKVRG